MKHSSKTKYSIILLVFWSVFPFQSGFVRCIGNDGHNEIEVAESGDCSSFETHDDSESIHSIPDSIQDHCADCIDIPLDSHEVQLSQRNYGPAFCKGLCFCLKQSFNQSTCLKYEGIDFTHFSLGGKSSIQRLNSVRLLI